MKIAITSNLCSAFDPNWRPKSLFSDTNSESRVTYTLFLTPICDENAIHEQPALYFWPKLVLEISIFRQKQRITSNLHAFSDTNLR